jgi:LemA protein
MAIWVLLGIVALGVVWLIATYNGLVALRNQTKNAWRQIDVQLKRRHDLIPNLVNTVKGVMGFEQETLEKVIQARNAAISAQGVAATAQAEQGLSQALGKLFALSEAYPELKSNQNALQLQEELTATENKIAFARQFYNDLVMRFNTSIQVFPTNLIAANMGFKEAESFEIDYLEREMPQIDLSLR